MNEVARIIEIYENKGIEGLLETASIPDDIKKVTAKLDTLSKAEKEKVETILKEVLENTEKRITDLENEIVRETQSLKSSQENADACIAYLSSAQTGEKK